MSEATHQSSTHLLVGSMPAFAGNRLHLLSRTVCKIGGVRVGHLESVVGGCDCDLGRSVFVEFALALCEERLCWMKEESGEGDSFYGC